MLAEDLFGRPSIMVVLSGQVEHFVAAPFNTGRSIGVESKVRIANCRVHGLRFTSELILLELTLGVIVSGLLQWAQRESSIYGIT
jgi:hypothetical protein